MGIAWMRFQMTRTWTSFPPSLWPPQHAPAPGAVLGTLPPAPSSRHDSLRWALLTVLAELCWPFIGHTVQRGLLPAQVMEGTGAWEGH